MTAGLLTKSRLKSKDVAEQWQALDIVLMF